jgi:hypothetical protein
MLSCQENEGESHAHLNLPGERLLRDSKVASKQRRDVRHYSEQDDTSCYRRTNMTELTLEPGVLRVASAFPDPPFEVTIDGKKTGFDVELMRLICEDLGLARHQVEYAGDDFNGIFETWLMEATTPLFRARRSHPSVSRSLSSPILTSSSARAWS